MDIMVERDADRHGKSTPYIYHNFTSDTFDKGLWISEPLLVHFNIVC